MSGEALGGDQAPHVARHHRGDGADQVPGHRHRTREEQVRERVLRWLREHPEMLDRDQIVLGGG